MKDLSFGKLMSTAPGISQLKANTWARMLATGSRMSWRGRQQLKCDEQYNYKYQNNDNKNNNNIHNNDNTPYKDD